MELIFSSLDVFNQESETVIYLKIEPNVTLSQVQQRFNAAFSTYGLAMSPFSNPADYKPHITMGYAPPGYTLPEFEVSGSITPEKVFMGRGNYEMVHEVPIRDWREAAKDSVEADGSDLTYVGATEKAEMEQWWKALEQSKRLKDSSKAHQATPLEELNAWEKKTLRGGLKKGRLFETLVLPAKIKSFWNRLMR
jgi:hypothetical protein